MTHTMQSCLMLMLQKHKNEPKVEDKFHDHHMNTYPEMVKCQIDLHTANADSGLDSKSASESEQQDLTDKLRHLFFNKGQNHHH